MINEFRIIQYRFDESNYKKLAKDESKEIFDHVGNQLFDKGQKKTQKEIDFLKRMIHLKTEKRADNNNSNFSENNFNDTRNENEISKI